MHFCRIEAYEPRPICLRAMATPSKQKKNTFFLLTSHSRGFFKSPITRYLDFWPLDAVSATFYALRIKRKKNSASILSHSKLRFFVAEVDSANHRLLDNYMGTNRNGEIEKRQRVLYRVEILK